MQSFIFLPRALRVAVGVECQEACAPRRSYQRIIYFVELPNPGILPMSTETFVEGLSDLVPNLKGKLRQKLKFHQL